jgi:hypothetical protein
MFENNLILTQNNPRAGASFSRCLDETSADTAT